MKKIVCLSLICLLIIPLFSSCGVVSNYITTGWLYTAESNGSMYIQSNFSKIYKIDIESKTFALMENIETVEFACEVENELKYEFFAGEYIAQIPDGYDGVEKHIMKCKLENDTSVVNACGYVNDKVLVGFVQVYEDTKGVHGNYAIEKISHSIAFSYNAETDKFSTIKRLDGVVIVAFANNTILYWKDKAYYSYDLTTNTEKHLVEDKAYDGGLNQTSTPAVFGNGEMCVFHLIKGKSKENIEYMYVFDFETNDFFELEWLK